MFKVEIIIGEMVVLTKYTSYKVYMGLIIKGTIPRVPPFSHIFPMKSQWTPSAVFGFSFLVFILFSNFYHMSISSGKFQIYIYICMQI